jgi:hypothetical protein
MTRKGTVINHVPRIDMKATLLYRTAGLFLMVATVACNQPAGYTKPDDGLDAGREYIRAVLDADYEKAELYIPHISDDRKFFDRYKEYMRQRSAEELHGLKESSIIVNKVEPEGDTAVIIRYSNSYAKKSQDVRMVRRDGEWWIDFKYTFNAGLPKSEP